MTEYFHFAKCEVQARSGRVYQPGEQWENPDGTPPEDRELPGGPEFWQVRRQFQVREDPECGRVGWNTGQRVPVKPPATVAGYDVLRGEVITEEPSPSAIQRASDGLRSWGPPPPSQEELHRRQLVYLRDFAPEQYASWISEHPEDAPGAAAQAAPAPELPAAPPGPEAPVSAAGDELK